MTPLTVVANDATGTWDLHRHGTLVCRLESESLAYLLAAAPTLYDACLAAFQDQGVLAPAIRNQAVMESLAAALDIADGPNWNPRSAPASRTRTHAHGPEALRIALQDLLTRPQFLCWHRRLGWGTTPQQLETLLELPV